MNKPPTVSNSFKSRQIEVTEKLSVGNLLSAVNTFTRQLSVGSYLTVFGNISATQTVFASGGNSNQWNSTFTTVQTNSGSWEESADITAITTAVASNSGNWNNAYNTGTVYQSNSASYATNTTVNSVSSLLVKTTDLDLYKTSVAASTATLLPTTIYQNASGIWQNTFTTVRTNSASWEESADILPTATNYLSTNNVLLSSVTVSNTLSINTVQIRTRQTANVFIGDSTTGNNNATGNHNLVFGLSAGNSLTSGAHNTFIGYKAGSKITSPVMFAPGNFNNFMGRYAGENTTSGNQNNFFGDKAGRYNTTGSLNNFLGTSAGQFNTSGRDNNFFGNSAGLVNTSGRDNNFLGRYAGSINTVGSNNTIIGNGADVATDSLSGVIVLGTGAIATQSNQIVLSTANVSFRSTGSTFEIGSPSLTDNLTVYGNITATQTIHALSSVVFTNLPTVSSSSAQQGTLWIDGGVLKVMGY